MNQQGIMKTLSPRESSRFCIWRRGFCAAFVVGLMVATVLHGQPPPIYKAPTPAAAAPEPATTAAAPEAAPASAAVPPPSAPAKLSQAELEKLLMPIALYP